MKQRVILIGAAFALVVWALVWAKTCSAQTTPVPATPPPFFVAVDARTQAACPTGVWRYVKATQTLTFYCHAATAPPNR